MRIIRRINFFSFFFFFLDLERENWRIEFFIARLWKSIRVETFVQREEKRLGRAGVEQRGRGWERKFGKNANAVVHASNRKRGREILAELLLSRSEVRPVVSPEISHVHLQYLISLWTAPKESQDGSSSLRFDSLR